jgi:hypothetical protein
MTIRSMTLAGRWRRAWMSGLCCGITGVLPVIGLGLVVRRLGDSFLGLVAGSWRSGGGVLFP